MFMICQQNYPNVDSFSYKRSLLECMNLNDFNQLPAYKVIRMFVTMVCSFADCLSQRLSKLHR